MRHPLIHVNTDGLSVVFRVLGGGRMEAQKAGNVRALHTLLFY